MYTRMELQRRLGRWFPSYFREVAVLHEGLRTGPRRKGRKGLVGTANVIHHVSRLKQIIVPGRVHHARHVHEKSPLRVFAAKSNRIVFGGCSPVKRLDKIATRCISILDGYFTLATFISSQSHVLTTSNTNEQSLTSHDIDRPLRGLVSDHGPCRDSNDPRGTLLPYRNSPQTLLYTIPVVTTKSIANDINLLARSHATRPSTTRLGTIGITTTFLTGRVRR